MAPRPRVLVIDNDPLFRKVTAGLLKKYYAVTTAESGAEGYEIALNRPPHVALIDVNLPGGSGLDTLSRFHEDGKLAGVKTAMLAGDASRETVVRAIRGGADEYIVKAQCTQDELLRKLRAMVAKSPLPIEDEPEPEPPPTSPRRVPTVQSPSRPAEEPVPAINNADPRLQDMIDGWD